MTVSTETVRMAKSRPRKDQLERSDLPCLIIIHLTLKMTSAQVVEMSVTNNSSFQNYSHPDDHNIQTIIIHVIFL